MHDMDQRTIAQFHRFVRQGLTIRAIRARFAEQGKSLGEDDAPLVRLMISILAGGEDERGTNVVREGCS